jgi:hypothetical protein
MKDLSNLTYFFGLEIHAGSLGIFLSQHKYDMNLMAAAGLQDLPPFHTPMEINIKLRKDEGDLLSDPTAYHTFVGNLIYLTNARPDISYAVQHVSQFMASPRHLIWLLLKESSAMFMAQFGEGFAILLVLLLI